MSTRRGEQQQQQRDDEAAAALGRVLEGLLRSVGSMGSGSCTNRNAEFVAQDPPLMLRKTCPSGPPSMTSRKPASTRR